MPLPPVPVFDPIAAPEAYVVAPYARFTVLTSRLLRLEFSPQNAFEDRPSQVFWYRNLPVPEFTQRVSPDRLEIETEHLLLSYHPGKAGFTARTLSILVKETGVTWTYGTKALEAANLFGTARTLDGDAGNSHLENGLLARAGWAVVNDSKSLVFNENGWLEGRSQPGVKDLYFFGYGKDSRSCLQDYTQVAGRIPLVPRYILGNWWSRYWEYSQAELQELMEEFQAHQLPLSVCIIDMDWHLTQTGNSSNGWTGYTWNKDLFPDPEGLISWLHEKGLRTALNLHPALGIFPHEEQYRDFSKWMGLDPSLKEPIPFDLADPRFAEAYFDFLHHPQEEKGVDFWWIDWQQGRKSSLGRLDPLWWLNHLHFMDLGRDGKKRPFIFSRWGGLGNHRYPIGFSGDTLIRWRTLAYQPYFTATAANVGYGWWSHDIGGHMGKEGSPELYLRWVQFGVFSPIFRLHSTKSAGLDRRPWSKPDRVFQAARQAMQLRHALIPYLYSMAWRAHRTGISLVTPMYYGQEDQEAVYAAKDQYYFGTELVAAPFLSPGDPETGKARRQVWLPEGTWFDFFQGRSYQGGGWQSVTGELEDIPVFAKGGAIVPLAPKVGWGGLDNPTGLDVYLFPGGESQFELYEDDGLTTDYLAGKFATTPMETTWQPGRLTFTLGPVAGIEEFVPEERVYRFHIRGIGQPLSCDLPGTYDPNTRTFTTEAVRPGRREQFKFEIRIEVEAEE